MLRILIHVRPTRLVGRTRCECQNGPESTQDTRWRASGANECVTERSSCLLTLVHTRGAGHARRAAECAGVLHEAVPCIRGLLVGAPRRAVMYWSLGSWLRSRSGEHLADLVIVGALNVLLQVRREPCERPAAMTRRELQAGCGKFAGGPTKRLPFDSRPVPSRARLCRSSAVLSPARTRAECLMSSIISWGKRKGESGNCRVSPAPLGRATRGYRRTGTRLSLYGEADGPLCVERGAKRTFLVRNSGSRSAGALLCG